MTGDPKTRQDNTCIPETRLVFSTEEEKGIKLDRATHPIVQDPECLNSSPGPSDSLFAILSTVQKSRNLECLHADDAEEAVGFFVYLEGRDW